MELLPTIRKSIIAFVLLPALLYAGIPPTLQSDASQRMTKDIMNRAYITPKRIVTKYAGCKNNLIKDEHYLLERGNGQSEMNRKRCCIMTSTETEKASLLLDFGSELHGGLKLVMGSSSRREPSLVRIRFENLLEKPTVALQIPNGKWDFQQTIMPNVISSWKFP